MTTETQEKVAKRQNKTSETPKSVWVAVFIASLQAAFLSVFSNVLAQLLTSYRHNTPFVLDWVPIFQFFTFNLLVTPPNFAWQTYLEDLFPSYEEPPKPKKEGPAAKPTVLHPEPRLNYNHVWAKTLMDQTIGAIINTFFFALYMFSIQEAMGHRYAHPVYSRPENSLKFLLSGKAVEYSRVNWSDTMEHVSMHFSSLLIAGWKMWPAVSLFNFTFVRTVETRNLVGALAGVAWGIYMSLFAAGH